MVRFIPVENVAVVHLFLVLDRIPSDDDLTMVTSMVMYSFGDYCKHSCIWLLVHM